SLRTIQWFEKEGITTKDSHCNWRMEQKDRPSIPRWLKSASSRGGRLSTVVWNFSRRIKGNPFSSRGLLLAAAVISAGQKYHRQGTHRRATQ
ncbi:hypothetical protein CEXT_9201, partial [Caerostris extrusa]